MWDVLLSTLTGSTIRAGYTPTSATLSLATPMSYLASLSSFSTEAVLSVVSLHSHSLNYSRFLVIFMHILTVCTNKMERRNKSYISIAFKGLRWYVDATASSPRSQGLGLALPRSHLYCLASVLSSLLLTVSNVSSNAITSVLLFTVYKWRKLHYILEAYQHSRLDKWYLEVLLFWREMVRVRLCAVKTVWERSK